MKTTYSYYAAENGSDIDDGYTVELNSNYDDDPEFIAQEAAEDYHSNHDGWESSWPIEITVVLTTGEHVACSVDREAVPQFHATEKRRSTSDASAEPR